jgi:hypothetical protein
MPTTTIVIVSIASLAVIIWLFRQNLIDVKRLKKKLDHDFPIDRNRSGDADAETPAK